MKIKIVALKKDEDFKTLLRGRKLSNKYFVMFYKKLLKKNSNNLNVSIVAKKKIFPKAVDRNFSKRRFKNVLNQAIKKIALNFNYSYLILAKDNVLEKNCFDDLKNTMFEEFNKIR
jgi:ribonuclease P protein component